MPREDNLEHLRSVWREAEAQVAAAKIASDAAAARAAEKAAAYERASADAEAELNTFLERPFTADDEAVPDPSYATLDLAASESREAAEVAGKARIALIHAEIAAREAEGAFSEEKHIEKIRAALAVEEKAAEAAASIEAHKRSKKSFQSNLKAQLVVGTIAVLSTSVVGGVLYLVLRKPEVVTPIIRMKGEPLGLDESSAQVFCEENIRQVAKDPEKVKVPYVRNQGQTGFYQFNWNSQTSMVRMRNGLGLEVAVQASCTVSSTSGKITSLTVDGQRVK